MKKYITLLIKYRFWVLALLVAVTGIFGAIASQGVIATSFGNMLFGEDHPGYQEYKKRIREFANDEVFIVIYNDDDLLSEKSLTRLEKVIERIEEIEDVGRVDSLLNAQHTFAEDDTLYVNKYADEALEEPEERENILENLKTDPLLDGLLISQDGQHAAVIIELEPDDNRPAERGPLLIREVIKIFEQGGFVRENLRLVGLMTTLAGIMEQANFNIGRLFPFVCIVLLLIVYLMFHRLWPVFITLLVSLVGVIWTFGFAVILDKNISLFTSLSPAIILIVATSDVIHLCNAYLLELAAGKSKKEAILLSCSEVGTACFWTSATTLVGFVSMVFVPVPAFQQLGVILGFGVAVSLILAMILTPILFSLLRPPKTATYKRLWTQNLLGRALFKSEQWVLKAPWIIISLFTFLFGFSIVGIRYLTIETDFNKRFAENFWVRLDEAYYNEHFAGANFLEIFIDTRQEQGVLDPETFTKIETFQRELEKLPDVDKVASLVNLIHTIDRQIDPEREEGWTRELLAQYLLLFEMGGGEDLERFVDFDRRTIRLAVRLTGTAARFTSTTGDNAKQLAASALDKADHTQVTGMLYLCGKFLDDIFIGQRRGLISAFVTIMLMMIFMFRSLKIGLWSMVPNILPLLTLGGYLGYFWDQVDSDTLVIAMIAVGIGVDDTIHFLTRLRFESGRNSDPVVALQRTLHFSGRAMVSTTVILALGFAPFAFSSYFSVRIFGTLLPFTLIVAVLADILLVPALVKVGIVRFSQKTQP